MHTRHRKILDMLQKGKVEIKAAAQQLGVTEMTIRRDLRLLEKQQLLMQVRGGAVLPPARYEPEQHDDEFMDLKFAIAEALYMQIMPCNAIFLSTGSTSLAFAKTLVKKKTSSLTVITNSLTIASALFRSRCKVILLGGELRSTSLDLVGHIGEKNIAEFHVDWLISGCDGAFSNFGFYTSDSSLSSLEKMSIKIADHVAIITASTKFGTRSLARFASLEDVDLLVTDNKLNPTDREHLLNANINIVEVNSDSY
ncbi:MAG: DeoR/GlpR transcriptional regulator [Lentisphaeria bacterium]|nr:DeoR/GlpR transcriptional regulator [Lentisphaeria bacterium]